MTNNGNVAPSPEPSNEKAVKMEFQTVTPPQGKQRRDCSTCGGYTEYHYEGDNIIFDKVCACQIRVIIPKD